MAKLGVKARWKGLPWPRQAGYEIPERAVVCTLAELDPNHFSALPFCTHSVAKRGKLSCVVTVDRDHLFAKHPRQWESSVEAEIHVTRQWPLRANVVPSDFGKYEVYTYKPSNASTALHRLPTHKEAGTRVGVWRKRREDLRCSWL